MAKKSRRAMRQKGFRLPPLAIVSLRIEPETWSKCEWAGQANGQSRSEFVRNTLANATRDAQPPEPREFRGISASAEELELWEKSAASRNYDSIQDWARFIFNRVAESDAADGYE